MSSRNYQPLAIKAECSIPDLDVSASKSEDGKTLVLQIVNAGDKAVTLPLEITGLVPTKASATVVTLEGALDDHNTANAPKKIQPAVSVWQPRPAAGAATLTFPAHSFSVIRL
jgi:alpha-L-arabinofuranosidase